MFLRATNAAKLLDLPISTFYQLVREGRLPPAASKIGKHRLWRTDQLVASADPEGYKSSHVTEAAAGHPPASPRERTGKVFLAPTKGDAPRREAGKTARRSPYTGVLGSSGKGP